METALVMLTLTEVAHALSSPIRTALLAVPPNETLGEAAARLGVATSTISHHLRVLEDAGLVIVDRSGTKKYLRPRHRELRLVLHGEGQEADLKRRSSPGG